MWVVKGRARGKGGKEHVTSDGYSRWVSFFKTPRCCEPFAPRDVCTMGTGAAEISVGESFADDGSPSKTSPAEEPPREPARLQTGPENQSV